MLQKGSGFTDSEQLKKTAAANISSLRKNAGLTQTAFAEKLNYSDKAVSKWERGESLPDIVTLKRIADMFSVTVDYILEEEHKTSAPKSHKSRNRAFITFGTVFAVWFIATLIYIGFDFFGDFASNWKVFIYAIPVSALLLLIFNSIWGKSKYSFIVISFLMWSILLTVYIIFLSYNPWLVFLLGISGEAIIILFSGIRKGKG